MRNVVWGVSVDDPLTFTLAAAVVVVMALVAVLIPSLQILRLDPVRALRAR